MKEKADLRALLKRRRAGLASGERCDQQRAVHRHLAGLLGGEADFPDVPAPEDIQAGLYYPVGDELSLLDLVAVPALSAVRWSLPVVRGKDQPLVFRRWSPEDALEEGAFGIPAPAPSASLVRPNLLLVPLLGVDERGHRIGYGGGFYDRTLAALRRAGPVLAIGAAYDCQKTPPLPVEPTDEPLDYIVTPSGMKRIEKPAE